MTTDSVALIVAEMRDYVDGNYTQPAARIHKWADRLEALASLRPAAGGEANENSD